MNASKVEWRRPFSSMVRSTREHTTGGDSGLFDSKRYGIPRAVVAWIALVVDKRNETESNTYWENVRGSEFEEELFDHPGFPYPWTLEAMSGNSSNALYDIIPSVPRYD